MDEKNLKTLAFPAISTGIFGYPIDKCAKIMIATTKKYLDSVTQIGEVIFCLYSKNDYEIFENELSLYK
jgi:O-acetyl-ADP-ribose deacetylase (regulator of RNase III)